MSFRIRVPLAAILGVTLTTAALADDGVRLSRLAASAGYTYQWSASDSGVTLQRPGVVVVLHAGYPLYEVNAIRAQADRAPEFQSGDLVVSPALAQRLRRIAIDHPRSGPSLPAVVAGETAPLSIGALTLSARQIPGREALALSGTGPPNAPLVITLLGEVSQEVPYVLINRAIVTCGPDGSFAAEAAIGQDMHLGTTIAATVTSLPGVAPATARVRIGMPSPGAASVLDQFPPK